MRKSRATVQKELLSLEEFNYYNDQGCKRLFYNNKPIRVEYECIKCGSTFNTTFNNLRTRIEKDTFLMCTKCAGSLNRHKMNLLRDKSYYENEEYRRKISRGVKKHYKDHPEAIQQRLIKKRKTVAENDVHYNPIKETVQGIKCESYGEAVFVKWMIEKKRSVRRSDIQIPYITIEGVQRMYYPDFIVDDKILIEVKCDFIRNFNKIDFEKIPHLCTYNLSELKRKISAAEEFCKKNNLSFELVTLDNADFNLRYNRAKRKRNADKINKKTSLSR